MFSLKLPCNHADKGSLKQGLQPPHVLCLPKLYPTLVRTVVPFLLEAWVQKKKKKSHGPTLTRHQMDTYLKAIALVYQEPLPLG